jgi:5-methyltetrahydrofolate--homocysteine methyltransferase
MVGGATTSQMHVALKIAPEYPGMVVWMKDAAQNVLAAARLSNPEEREVYRKEIEVKYEELRQKYAQQQIRLIPIEEARRNKLELFSNEE